MRVPLSIVSVLGLTAAIRIFRVLGVMVSSYGLSRRGLGVSFGDAGVPAKCPLGVAHNQDSQPEQRANPRCDAECRVELWLSAFHRFKSVFAVES